MDQPTDPPPARQSDEPHPLCPCGDPTHTPNRIGASFSSSGSGALTLYACPESQRYRLGEAS